MAILTMEVRGLGTVDYSQFAMLQPTQAAAVAAVANYVRAAPAPPPPVTAPSFLETWGSRLGAGAAGLAIGFVIAKLARRKRG